MFNNVQELEKHILSQDLLKLKYYNVYNLPNCITTVRSFLDLFFLDLNKNHHTVDLDDNVDTFKNKLRSLGDIFRITKYYMPNATLNDVLKTLKDYHSEGILYSHICSSLDKRIYSICEKDPYFYITGRNGDSTYYCDEDCDEDCECAELDTDTDEFGFYGEDIFNLIDTVDEIIVEEPIINPVVTINNKTVSRDKCRKINGNFYECYVDVFPGYSPKRNSTWFTLDTINNNSDIKTFNSMEERFTFINKLKIIK